ncbi:MAG: hypothetical protein R3253_10030 [Longimicrobiales bacterium]|nr:hypothetical protein [Longimicrobiales bacterium]
MRNKRLALAAVAALVACGGEGGPESSTASAPAIPEIRFTAHDFTFEGPDTIQAGLVTFALTNEGETLHHLQLVRLPEGMSMEEFQEGMAQMQPGMPPPPWLHDAGGVNPPPPGRAARVTQHIEAGEYAVLCFVDTPDRVPHVMKGMIRPLTVLPSRSPAAPLPASDLTLTLVDYAFGFSAPPTAATRVIRVENAATQSHEIAVFRFLPGKTMDDLVAWATTYEGPEPFEPVGGVPAIHAGQAVNMEVELTPGDYVALCFVPDATDGKLHLEHGMAMPFSIS